MPHTQIGWVFAHICTPESVTIEPLYSADKTKTFSQLAQLDRGTYHAPTTCHVVTQNNKMRHCFSITDSNLSYLW